MSGRDQDCNNFILKYTQCNIDERTKVEDAVEITFGDGICDSRAYSSECYEDSPRGKRYGQMQASIQQVSWMMNDFFYDVSKSDHYPKELLQV